MLPRTPQNIFSNIPFLPWTPLKFGDVLHMEQFDSSRWMMSLGSLSFSTQTGSKPGHIKRLRRKQGIQPRMIQTLDPSRLLPSDFQDISHLKSPRLVAASKASDRKSYYSPPISYKRLRADISTNYLPFPAGTHGFFYYRPPNNPAPTRKTQPLDKSDVKSVSDTREDRDEPHHTSGVFFRITKDSDPASFASGKDLMQHDGDVPWYIVPHSRPSVFWRLLLEDKSTTTSTKRTDGSRLTKSIISNIGDPFLLDLSTLVTRVNVRSLIDGSVFALLFVNPLRSRIGSSGPYHPCYEGRLRCQFERSLHPEHANTDTFVIRVVEVLPPITYALRPSANVEEDPSVQPPLPRAGDLLPARRRKGIGGFWHHKAKSMNRTLSKTQTDIHRAWDVLVENEALARGRGMPAVPQPEQT